MSITMALLLVALSAAAVAASSKDRSNTLDRYNGPLRFSQDGTFQISVMQDLHFGESMSPNPDRRTLKY